ncbi:MAG: hypothetical protein WBJ16_06335 [Smithellaceae bacterium]|jgi:hypothetical protein
MGFFSNFSNSGKKKGEQIADAIIRLSGENNFTSLLAETPKPMSLRILIDHIIVCSAAAAYALAVFSKGKPNDWKQVYGSMIDRIVFHLEKMSDSGVNMNVRDVIVNDEEKSIFLGQGWHLNETTSIYTIFSVIGDLRMDKYSRAIAEGLAHATQDSDGSRMTALLMQETKKNCGADGFPYIELKLIYTNRIGKIVQICSN